MSLDTPSNYCVNGLKFRVREHGMPCALEIYSNGESKRGHVESSPLTKKNISTTTIPMATKLGREVRGPNHKVKKGGLVRSCDRRKPLYLHLPECLGPPNLAE